MNAIPPRRRLAAALATTAALTAGTVTGAAGAASAEGARPRPARVTRPPP